ncbi:deazaflavin-dependent oxidoreductase (nitroreductase family) [Actinocorallia herbida]|uniref:Deazaflavin-dependent oxidoreductase (Nitroreductase family) n=1 Tax=Actinocorallia herbida TaxID=58109 RepID=A0A3N1CUW5_9ACTN|nr:nitroreductase family deazaflavin-dependent oxidoreductase [Actinocorallia herbida]ROO85100.1 deazaflavin-dependent oxidoreductase (nitroreductase family) [Actinocorallia herbida]
MRYVEAGRSGNLLNRVVGWLTGRGLSLWGSQLVAVRGRKSGEWRTNPVNPLTMDGERYLVAPRGHTQWVRNLRAAEGRGELRLGSRVEPFTAVEVPDEGKPQILRAYLERWKFEVGLFFEGLDHHSSDADLLRVASGYPVFRLTSARYEAAS